MDYAVHNSISRSWRLGKAILEARKDKIDPMIALEKYENAKLIFKGKIIHVERGIVKGFNIGKIIIEGFDEEKDNKLKIKF